MGLLLGIVVLLAVGGVIAAFLLTRHHRHVATSTTTTVVVTSATPAAPVQAAAVPVPDLVGTSRADAVASLKNDGLGVRLVTVSGPPPAGSVLGESPAAGANAPARSIVTLRVSNGLAGQSAATTTSAQTTTANTATTPPATQTSTAPATTPATTPVATSPAQTTPATTAPATTPASPASATVPDVSGGDVQAAANALSQAGLLASIQYVPGGDPLGAVVAESPAAGAKAPSGSHVTVNASSGPGQKPQEQVPDASGLTIPEAVAAMQHAGLRLIFVKKTVTEASEDGKVVEQTPAAGKTAPKNAQVLVYMGASR
ncbi:MAG TPA: PASTA domain-containing protein [Gaiellaceae bacterium]|nr:PASTA domain-containing protein [Gaiellaceae bacterium]